MVIPIDSPKARTMFSDLVNVMEESISGNLEKAGAFLEAKMVEKISSGLSPALKPATISRKGSSQPLVDKGQMMGQISHQQKDKNSVNVGVFGSRAGIALVHEMGSPSRGIPERSFIRSTTNENKDEIIRIVVGK